MDNELSADELAAMDVRQSDRMRRRIERGEILFDAQCREFYQESNGAVLDTDSQVLLMGWRSEGVIEVVNPHMHRNCKVRML